MFLKYTLHDNTNVFLQDNTNSQHCTALGGPSGDTKLSHVALVTPLDVTEAMVQIIT